MLKPRLRQSLLGIKANDMDLSQLLRALGLQQAYQSYQENIGQPFANVAGPFGRGLLGLERPEYGQEQAYRTGQAVGNMPAVSAPVGAFKALAQIPGLLEAASVAPAIFIGPRARTWNKASAEAFEKLEKGGVSNKDAYFQTGTFRSPDGQLRQEISDVNSIPGQRFLSWGESKDLQQGDTAVVRRQKALLHPELSAAYPDTKAIGVTLVPKEVSSRGSYNPDFDTIRVDAGKNFAADRSLMLHELQHAIQKREGFESGGSPRSAADFAAELIQKNQNRIRQIEQNSDFAAIKALDDDLGWKYVEGKVPFDVYEKQLISHPGYELLQEYGKLREFMRTKPVDGDEAYRRLAGEAEARAVQARMNYPTEELRKMFPLESYDVPIDQLIVRGLLNQ